ncbi:MAG: type II secretion system protein [Candidatus Omnitrophota bacterium]|nr:type II secretion system protein [Candidatus Omnitrophota bacterium]
MRGKTGPVSLNSGFTYIELLVTIAIISVCFFPLLRLFSTSVVSVAGSSDLATALDLAREEMEKMKNLNYSEAQLAAVGNVFYPPAEKPPLTLNKQDWRVERIIIPGSDPLEVHVRVFKTDNMKKPVARLVTLIEDLQ